jgi:hypothetical protein
VKLVLSGEGATDLGAIQVGSNGENFVPGPMALIVDKLLERHHTAYSLIESHDAGGDCIVYVAKSELSSFAKKGLTLLPGQKYGKGNAFFVSNAQCLGLYAKKLSAEEAGIPVIAILFRDGDGTNSKKEWSAKVESMRRGFELVEFRTGVSMVPNPKSEAWLICALRSPAYSGCASLEDESGNDNSSNPLKEQLARLCGGLHPSAETQADWVRDGRVDPSRIEMPSFSVFKEDLRKAARNAGFSDLAPSLEENR